MKSNYDEGYSMNFYGKKATNRSIEYGKWGQLKLVVVENNLEFSCMPKYDYIVEKWNCNKKSNQNNNIPFIEFMKIAAEYCNKGTKTESNRTKKFNSPECNNLK